MKCAVCNWKIVGRKDGYCSQYCAFKLRYMYYDKGKKGFTQPEEVIEARYKVFSDGVNLKRDQQIRKKPGRKSKVQY